MLAQVVVVGVSFLRCPMGIIINSEQAIIYTSAHLQPDLQSAALIHSPTDNAPYAPSAININCSIAALWKSSVIVPAEDALIILQRIQLPSFHKFVPTHNLRIKKPRTSAQLIL